RAGSGAARGRTRGGWGGGERVRAASGHRPHGAHPGVATPGGEVPDVAAERLQAGAGELPRLGERERPALRGLARFVEPGQLQLLALPGLGLRDTADQEAVDLRALHLVPVGLL